MRSTGLLCPFCEELIDDRVVGPVRDARSCPTQGVGWRLEDEATLLRDVDTQGLADDQPGRAQRLIGEGGSATRVEPHRPRRLRAGTAGRGRGIHPMKLVNVGDSVNRGTTEILRVVGDSFARMAAGRCSRSGICGVVRGEVRAHATEFE